MEERKIEIILDGKAETETIEIKGKNIDKRDLISMMFGFMDFISKELQVSEIDIAKTLTETYKEYPTE